MIIRIRTIGFLFQLDELVGHSLRRDKDAKRHPQNQTVSSHQIDKQKIKRKKQDLNIETKTGTLVGTLASVLANIVAGDLAKTAVLAAVGAAVSFIVSWLLKQLTNSQKNN